MSFRRTQSRAINHHVFLDNRLTNFVGEHVHFGDLIIERDALINGNLTVKQDIRARSFYATGNFYLDNYILVPAGTIVQSASINVPDGWLNCNGALLNKIAYAELFFAIGNVYGGEPTDLSFNLPDMRGRVGIGAGQGADLTNRIMGEKSGVETHALNVDEMPAHNHGVTDPGHFHGYINNTGDQSVNNILSNETAADQEDYSATTGVSTTGISINNTGSGLGHNNMQPFLVIRYLIKY
jgi:microcystin-dependent protein